MRRIIATCLLALGVSLLGTTSSFAATNTGVHTDVTCGAYTCGGW
ncbi:hypothetical protein [Streptomyces sp. NPDC017673]